MLGKIRSWACVLRASRRGTSSSGPANATPTSATWAWKTSRSSSSGCSDRAPRVSPACTSCRARRPRSGTPRSYASGPTRRALSVPRPPGRERARTAGGADRTASDGPVRADAGAHPAPRTRPGCLQPLLELQKLLPRGATSGPCASGTPIRSRRKGDRVAGSPPSPSPGWRTPRRPGRPWLSRRP